MSKIKKILKGLKWIGIVGVAIAGAIFATKAIRKATIGKIYRRQTFLPVPGKPKLINIIKDDGSTETIELPNGWKYREVKAAGISKTGNVKVEIKHEKTSIRDSLDNNGSIPDGYTRGRKVRTNNER